MKVGLLDTLGSRYLRFWEPYVQDLGVELVRPALPKREAYELGQASLPDEPPHVQLALGRILEMGRADVVLLPQLSGVAEDPWGEAFADVLTRRVSSLPALMAVPASGEGVASLATELGVRFTQNPGLVRRALDRRRPLLAAPRVTMPNLSAASQSTFALIGPEVLLAEKFLLGTLPAELQALNVHPILSTDLPRDLVTERGLRSPGGTPGERELAGALGVLDGKGAVRGSILAVPERASGVRAVAERTAATAHKPTLVVEVSPDRDDWSEVRRFVERTLSGAQARAAREEN